MEQPLSASFSLSLLLSARLHFLRLRLVLINLLIPQGGGGGGPGGVGQRGAQQLHDGLPQPLQVDMFHISRISAHESPSFPRRQKKEGVDVSEEAESGLDRGTDQELLDDEEDVLDYYYDIETSAETMPNVNWTMLTPR